MTSTVWLQLLHRKKKNQYADWQDYPVLLLKRKHKDFREIRETSQACENLSCIVVNQHEKHLFSSLSLHTLDFFPRLPPTWDASGGGKGELPVVMLISLDI